MPLQAGGGASADDQLLLQEIQGEHQGKRSAGTIFQVVTGRKITSVLHPQPLWARNQAFQVLARHLYMFLHLDQTSCPHGKGEGMPLPVELAWHVPTCLVWLL